MAGIVYFCSDWLRSGIVYIHQAIGDWGQIGFVIAVVVSVMPERGFCVVMEGVAVSSAVVVGATEACEVCGLLVAQEGLVVGGGLVTGMFALF